MKSTTLFLSLLALTTLFSTACREDDFDCLNYEWHYEGESEPDTWASCHSQCGGQAQSPIDLTNPQVDAALTALQVEYADVPFVLLNNGHTLKFPYASGSYLRLDGVDYALDQFHFHTGSEHTTDGQQYAMEVHLVHKNAANGNYAVIGLLLTEGTENPFLNHITSAFPIAEGDTVQSQSLLVNIKDLLPADQSYYTYDGSFTTPDCDEIVSWFVMKTAVQASSAQIDAIHQIIGFNYRPVQDLNGRQIRMFN